MVDVITLVYLSLMFIALYMLAFFIILTFRNNKELMTYERPRKFYSVSVLIPAYNEQDSIKETIEHVANLDYPKNKLEIIVVNDGSKDKTREVVEKLIRSKKYFNLKIINKKNSGKADSLNQGVEMAKGELIAVVDSDSFPSPSSLYKLVGYFNNKEMGAVTSFVTVRNKNQNILTRLQSLEYMLIGWSRKLLDFINSVYVTNGPLSVYRKQFILNVGGFDKQSITEDIDITWNMLYHGYKTSMCLDARVSTITPHKFKPWFRQRMRWGAGGLQALQKYRKMFFKRGIFGYFVMPFVSLSILVSLVSFIFSMYLLLKAISAKTLSIGYSIALSSSIIHLQEINLSQPIMIFFLVILFICSTTYYHYVLQTARYEENLNLKRFLFLILYMLVYLALYPVVWFASIYKYVKGDFRW